MAITTLNRHDSSPSTTNQRPYDEVYQTPRLRSSHPYRNGQARLAPSRHLRHNDANRSGVSRLQNVSFSEDLGGSSPMRNALERSPSPRPSPSAPLGTIDLVGAFGREMLDSESVLDLKVLPIPPQLRGVSQCMLPHLWWCSAVDPIHRRAHSGVLSQR